MKFTKKEKEILESAGFEYIENISGSKYELGHVRIGKNTLSKTFSLAIKEDGKWTFRLGGTAMPLGEAILRAGVELSGRI